MHAPRVLAVALTFALPLAAQTVAEPKGPTAPDGKTEMLWRIETSGIGG